MFDNTLWGLLLFFPSDAKVTVFLTVCVILFFLKPFVYRVCRCFCDSLHRPWETKGFFAFCAYRFVFNRVGVIRNNGTQQILNHHKTDI